VESWERIGGSGDCTSRLSSVRSTATPASTLPTVSETNILASCGVDGVVMVLVRRYVPASSSWSDLGSRENMKYVVAIHQSGAPKNRLKSHHRQYPDATSSDVHQTFWL
jgi:hypothetical protein